MPKAYDETKLKRAQQASLKILLAVDAVCRANGIAYLLDAGTLIGAVRHQGFIPWDDDIDIAMTRDNFDRFVKAVRGAKRKNPEDGSLRSASLKRTSGSFAETAAPAKPDAVLSDTALSDTALPDTMELILPDEYRGGRAFYDFTPRIIYKPSQRHADSKETRYYEGKLNHLWVDIFILDAIPDNAFLDAGVRFLQKCIYGFSMPRRFHLDLRKYNAADRLRVRALSLAGRLFRMPELFRLQDRLSRAFDRKKTKRLYYSNYQPDFLYVTVDRDWCVHTAELPFEGHMLMVPAGYDAVLREVYGDYMKLPPEASRVPSHSDELDVFE